MFNETRCRNFTSFGSLHLRFSHVFFLWYVLISTCYFFASFHPIFVILDLYWRGMFLQQKYIAKYHLFQNVFFCTFSGKMKKKKTGKMYNSDVLFVWKHKWTQCRRNFFRTCVSYVLRPKPKESVKNWWRNNTSKFGHNKLPKYLKFRKFHTNKNILEFVITHNTEISDQSND